MNESFLGRPKLHVIVASIRPGRVGLPVSKWFASHAETHGAFDVSLVDLAEINLPMNDEAKHPRLRQYQHDYTKRWSAVVDEADAYVFVSPEYNHSYPASLKNALDYLHQEWQEKPAGFVTYGGVSAGTRALVALRPVVAALGMPSVPAAVNVPFVNQFLDEQRNFVPNEMTIKGADQMLGQLASWTASMSSRQRTQVAAD